MRVRPQGIDDRRLSRALEEHWGLAPARLEYLPVGFGDHHWELTDRAGRRWFVTVAELASAWRGTGAAAGYADLRAAMDTVVALAGAGLEFAVAPVPTAGGRALAPLGGEHAITLFPYLAGDFGGELSAPDRIALIDMLARLHDATPLAASTAPVLRPELAVRQFLETALRELSQPWHGGPYSEPARQLVARHASPFGRALARFDALRLEAAQCGPLVITHGEPHSDNILRSAGRLYLIDWGSAGLAPPERDLWDLAGPDSREADRYAELTGRRVDAAVMRMYRMRWSLEEIMLSVREFRGPHEHNGDTELAWEALTEETENLLLLAP
jgi:spectinomycin phosphotransferase